MANPPKPWKAEYAKSSRSSCKTCKSPIEKETLRLGKMVQSTQFDGFMPTWNHASCILRIAKQIRSVDDVEGLELLRWEDQQKIRKYVEDGALLPNSSAPTSVESGIEISQTSRATCRSCNQKIAKGEIRISTKPEGQGARSLTWNHGTCYMETSPTDVVETFSGWDSLSDSDRSTILSLVKKNPSASKGTKVDRAEEKESLQESKSGSKRKKAVESDKKSKIAKVENLKGQLEVQSKALRDLKDDL